jgi:hypothetical protein
MRQLVPKTYRGPLVLQRAVQLTIRSACLLPHLGRSTLRWTVLSDRRIAFRHPPYDSERTRPYR